MNQNLVQFPGGNKLSKRRRHHPTDPAEIARLSAENRLDPALWGLPLDSLALPANRSVQIQGYSRKHATRARRYDVFALMYFHPKALLDTPTYEAVRRFQKDLAVLHRTQGASDVIRTTSKGGGWLTEGFTHAQLEAGEHIDEAMSTIKAGDRPWAGPLIRELCEHEVTTGSEANWHAVVRRLTGELRKAHRGALVRAAAIELCAAYAAIDNTPRRQRA